MRSASVRQPPAGPCSSTDVIADFYREEFLKRQAHLRQQREYYSERAVAGAEAALDLHPAAHRNPVRARSRRSTGQPAPALHRCRHRRPGCRGPEEGSLIPTLAELRDDALAIVRAALSAADAGACVARGLPAIEHGHRERAALEPDRGGQGRRADGGVLPGRRVAAARTRDGRVAGPVAGRSRRRRGLRRRPPGPDARAASRPAAARSRSRAPRRATTSSSSFSRAARRRCSSARPVASRWPTSRPPRHACFAPAPTSRR